MKFEVINDKQKTVMQTTNIACVPNETEIKLMTKAGYKFRMNGKLIKKSDLQKIINNEVK